MRREVAAIEKWVTGAVKVSRAVAFAGLLGPARSYAATDAVCEVEIQTTVPNAHRAVAQLIVDHLRAELSARGIVLAVSTLDAQKARLRIRVVVTDGPKGLVTALIELDDSKTKTRISRTVELLDVPEDARPLAIAASVDELLRASLFDASPTTQQPGAERSSANHRPTQLPLATINSTVRDASESTRPKARWELAVAGRASLFSAQTSLGGGVQLAAPLWAHTQGTVGLGVDTTLKRASAHGTVTASIQEVVAGFALSPWAPVGTVRFRLVAELAAQRLHYNAMPNTVGMAMPSDDWSLSSVIGADAIVDTGQIFWFSSVSSIATLRPSTVTDQSQLVQSNRGVGVQIAIGVGANLR